MGVNGLEWVARKPLVFAHLRALPVVCNRKWVFSGHIKTLLFPSSVFRLAPNVCVAKSTLTTKYDLACSVRPCTCAATFINLQFSLRVNGWTCNCIPLTLSLDVSSFCTLISYINDPLIPRIRTKHCDIYSILMPSPQNLGSLNFQPN